MKIKDFTKKEFINFMEIDNDEKQELLDQLERDSDTISLLSAEELLESLDDDIEERLCDRTLGVLLNSWSGKMYFVTLFDEEHQDVNILN